MQIKNDITIYINKEVALALLSIDESMNLKHVIIFHVSYLLDKPGPSCTTVSRSRSVNAWDRGKQQRLQASSTRLGTGI